MAIFRPAYRLRVYAPRSTDPTEATVLTPAAGAPHSDPFQVASIAGVTGYQPYLMDAPQGRSGRIDLLKRKTDTGTRVFLLIDKRVGAVSDNLVRWVTAFFGDVKGKPPGRLRVEADETLDGGVTWPPFAVMELVQQQLIQKVGWQLSLRDRLETLKMKVFVGQPSATLSYVAQPTLFPIGFRVTDYGKLKATLPAAGTIKVPTVNGVNYAPSAECYVSIPSFSPTNLSAAMLTQNLVEAIAPNTVRLTTGIPAVDNGNSIVPNYSGVARCHLKRLDTNAEGDFRVGGIQVYQGHGGDVSHHLYISGVFLHELASNDVGYMAVPPAATSVEISLSVDGPVSDTRPILIADVDPATYIQDLAAGKFSYLFRAPDVLPTGKNYGDPMRAVTCNTTAATPGCVSDLVGTRPPMRKPVMKVSDALTEIEQVCLENDWVPYLDESGRLNIVDLRLPITLAGVPTITDTDVDETQDVDWQHDPTQAVLRLDITQYSERVVTMADLMAQPDLIPRLEGTARLEETAHKLEPLFVGSIDYGDNTIAIDAKGCRSMDGEAYQSQPRATYIENALFELGNRFQRPFAYGLTSMPLRCRRTATINGLTLGALVIVAASVVPDPFTHKRGGSRVCRITELTKDGPGVTLRLVDLGAATVALVPTIGAPAQETGNTYDGVTVTVTLNAAAQPAEVRYAVTTTAVGAAPADNSPLWTVAGYKTAVAIFMARRRLPNGATFGIRGVPPGMRVWVQGRSLPISSVELQFPSAWVLAGGSGYVDTAAVTAPSVLTAVKTDKTVALSWTNGTTDLATEILLATPTSDPRRRVAIADPGSTSYDITHLDPSTQYRAEVRHMFGEHVSAGVTVDFTTDATSAALPDIVAFQFLLAAS